MNKMKNKKYHNPIESRRKRQNRYP